MSNPNNGNDMDRYFNDPDYRKKMSERTEDTAVKEAPPKKEKKNDQPDGTARSERVKKWVRRQPRKYKIAAGALVFIFLLIAVYVFYLFQGLPSIQQLENPQTARASVVLSSDGVVLDKFYTENRTYVPINEISPHVIHALVATEDHRFYNHWGVDVWGVGAAVYDLITSGDLRGASTISQQLARNLYKKIGNEITITRKLREMITAIQIEQNYTKREILEMYLNTVEYANSAFGIESAAYTHYGKNADELNVLQAATMIGSLKAVYAYNPRIFPEHSKGRRNIILMQMHKRGFIDDEAYNQLRQKPITLNYHPPSKAGTSSQYFGEYVRQMIAPWAKENGYNLESDGLRIYTTINSSLQKYAKMAVEQKLDSLQAIFIDEWTTSEGNYMNLLWSRYPGFLKSFIRQTDRYKNAFSKLNTDQESVVFEKLMADEAWIDSVKRANTRLQAGFVAIEPETGYIRAWVGGRDYGNVQYDHVWQMQRQAGSTFKPFVYTVAIANGYKPFHELSMNIERFYGSAGQVWTPKGAHAGDSMGTVTIRKGLARSLNIATVDLLTKISGAPGTDQLDELRAGAQKIKQMAANFGIDMSNTPPYPSIALGTAKVSLLELTSAYTVFANEGIHIDPIAVTHIEDKHGNIIKKFNPDFRKEVISPETAYIMVDMLRSAITGDEGWPGTGARIQWKYNIGQDIGGKTGTTQNAADNWFVAVMPHLVVGAWVGGEDRRIRWPTYSATGQGAHTALPIVGRFISLVTSDPNAPWSYKAFQAPPGFIMPQPPEDNFQQRDFDFIDDDNGRIDW